jgi:hypothetical protein
LTKVWTTLSRRPKAPEGVAVGVVVPGVPNAGVVKEAAVAVVCLEDAAVGELAVEDLEAVEVAEVVEVNQGNKYMKSYRQKIGIIQKSVILNMQIVGRCWKRTKIFCEAVVGEK